MSVVYVAYVREFSDSPDRCVGIASTLERGDEIVNEMMDRAPWIFAGSVSEHEIDKLDLELNLVAKRGKGYVWRKPSAERLKKSKTDFYVQQVKARGFEDVLAHENRNRERYPELAKDAVILDDNN